MIAPRADRIVSPFPLPPPLNELYIVIRDHSLFKFPIQSLCMHSSVDLSFHPFWLPT